MTTVQRVKYPYRWIQDTDQVIVLDCVPPQIGDQRQLNSNFWLYQTDDDVVTKLSSALATGLRLEYPDEENQLYWNFWEAFACMELCQAVLASFNDNADCQLGLTDLLNALGFGEGGGSTGEVIPSLANQNLNLNTDCTDAGTYGVAYAMVDQMNTVVEDWLDIISGVADALELVGELIDAVPVVGSAVGAAYDFATFIFNEIVSAYSAAWNTSTHDQIACEVWQYVCGDCTLTIDDMIEAYKQFVPLANIPATDSNWLEWSEWFADLIVNTDAEIVASMHLVILIVWARGSAWAGSSQRQLQIASQQASSLSPPVGCDCLGLWCYDFDFTASDFATYWNVTGTTATYVAGIGYQGVDPNIYTNLLAVDGNILIHAEIEYSMVSADGTNTFVMQGRSDFNKAGTNYNLINGSGQNGTNMVKQWDGSQLMKSVLSNPNTNGGTATIHRIKLSGRGTSPYPIDNC